MAREVPIWNAVVAAEEAGGKDAESFAREEAKQAAASGDTETAATWNGVADELWSLHSINRQRVSGPPLQAKTR